MSNPTVETRRPKAGGAVHTLFSPLGFGLTLAVLLAAAFPGVWLGFQTFVFRDFGLFSYPSAWYLREAIAHGRFPFWDPLNFCGTPFMAQWNTLVLYPPSLVYLLFPLTWSLPVFCLIHLFLGGMGMYVLGRRWTGDPWAAAVAGMGYAFSGILLSSLMWPCIMASLGWMPWVVDWVERAWTEGGRRIAEASALGALQMLTGAPEVIGFTWLFLVGLWCVECFRPRGAAWRQGLRLLAVIGWVAALAAIQLLPFLELLSQSHRFSHVFDGEWSVALSGWASYLLPLFHTLPYTGGVWMPTDQHWLTSYYAGAGILLLAVFALVRVRQRRGFWLAVVSLAGFLLALGNKGFLLPLMSKVLPPVRMMRYPVKFIILPSFTLPLLAAFGVSRLSRGTGEGRSRDRRILTGFACAGIVLIGALVVWNHYWLVQRKADVSEWQVWLNGGERAAWLLLICACLLWATQASLASRRRLACAVCLFLVGLDGLTQAPVLNPTVPRWVYQAGLMRQKLHFRDEVGRGRGRVLLTPAAQLSNQFRYQANPVTDYLGRRLGMLGDVNLLDGIPKVHGIFPLKLRDLDQVYALFYTSTNRLLPSLADYLDIAYASTPGKLLDWSFRPSHLPLVTIGQQPVFADRTTILRSLRSKNFDPRHTIYLPLAARSRVRVLAGKAHVVDLQFKPQQVDIVTMSQHSSLLSIAQAYYPAWQARVNGRPAKIWEANGAFQAVVVPPGRAHVSVTYVDRPFEWGGLISLFACIGLAWGWGRSRGCRNGGISDPPPPDGFDERPNASLPETKLDATNGIVILKRAT